MNIKNNKPSLSGEREKKSIIINPTMKATIPSMNIMKDAMLHSKPKNLMLLCFPMRFSPKIILCFSYLFLKGSYCFYRLYPLNSLFFMCCRVTRIFYMLMVYSGILRFK